jgi:hypothetical protein
LREILMVPCSLDQVVSMLRVLLQTTFIDLGAPPPDERERR